MALLYNNKVYNEEEQNDTWVVVRETTHCENTRQQIEACDTSSTLPKPAIIIDNEEALSDLAWEPVQSNSYIPTVGVVLHSVESLDGNPTPDSKVVVESTDSTATGQTFSTPEDVSSDKQPSTPAEHDSPSKPLTLANLGPSNTPVLIRDIQAWINRDPEWLRVPVNCDQASDVPLARATTRHSSNGSLDFVFIPAQPPSFGRDAAAIGTLFEHTPFTKTYGSDMELEED